MSQHVKIQQMRFDRKNLAIKNNLYRFKPIWTSPKLFWIYRNPEGSDTRCKFCESTNEKLKHSCYFRYVHRIIAQLKFIYSEKATKLCEIFTLLLSYVVPVKSKVKISQNFVAFSEYMNFTCQVQGLSHVAV